MAEPVLDGLDYHTAGRKTGVKDAEGAKFILDAGLKTCYKY